MSRAEVERFHRDLQTNDALLAEVKKADRELGLATEVAARHGYSFTVDEMKTYITARAQAQGKPLSDSQLDKMAGGYAEPCAPCRNRGNSNDN